MLTVVWLPRNKKSFQKKYKKKKLSLSRLSLCVWGYEIEKENLKKTVLVYYNNNNNISI